MAPCRKHSKCDYAPILKSGVWSLEFASRSRHFSFFILHFAFHSPLHVRGFGMKSAPIAMNSKVPADLKYARSHEWVLVTGGLATVGITDHAQHELTDVVFVELPAVGRRLQAGEACAVVESVKTASDIYAPVSGEVVAVNQQVVEQPALVNQDPYIEGWFFQVQLAQPAEADALLNAEQYRAFIGQ